MKRLFVRTMGCQMNVRDSEEVTGLLLGKGYARTDSEQTADVILFNTCSVREHAEHRVWSNVGALKEIKAQRPELVIGVMGCMAKAQRGTIFERMPHVDFISGPSQLYEVPELIEAVYKSRLGVNPEETDGGCNSVAVAGPIAAIQQKRRAEFKTISYHASSISAMVTIMEGCDKVCSYCIIPYTRGPEVSRPPEQIVEEVHRLAGEGYREVMLLGQNVNSYGRRFPGEGTVSSGDSPLRRTETTFAGLLAEVNEVPGIERIRFITSHPWDAVEELFDAMRDLEHLCEHLHLPVQSGSDSVLKRMRRGYTGQEYLEKLDLLREKVPEVAVTTDLIVGFPGETEADFEATVRLVERARFDSAFIFAYSPRPFAAASRWEDDVPAEVKDRRLQRLLALQEKITRQESDRQVGRTLEVMVEEPGMGRSRQNRKVYFSDTAAAPGERVEVQAREVRGQSLIGSAVRTSTSSARTAAALLLAMVFCSSPAFAAEDLVSLQGAFLRGEYERVLRESQGSTGSEDALLYLTGVSALKLGDQEEARQRLNDLLDRYPRSPWAPQAWFSLGLSWEASGKPDEALNLYQRYLREGTDHSLEPQVTLRVAAIQQQMGLWEEAKVSLQSAMAKGEGTPAAERAREILSSGEFYFCVQVGAFAAEGNADRLAQELQRRGYEAEVSHAALQGRMFHRVRVGRFSARSGAEQEARRLQQDGFPAKVFP